MLTMLLAGCGSTQFVVIDAATGVPEKHAEVFSSKVGACAPVYWETTVLGRTDSRGRVGVRIPDDDSRERVAYPPFPPCPPLLPWPSLSGPTGTLILEEHDMAECSNHRGFCVLGGMTGSCACTVEEFAVRASHRSATKSISSLLLGIAIDQQLNKGAGEPLPSFLAPLSPVHP
jgi:hypothetical protein